LVRDGGLTVVSSQELAGFASEPLYDQNGVVNRAAALQAASRMQLDAVLIGKLHRRRESALGQISEQIQIGDPIVTVRIGFQLIDVRTGTVVAEGQPEQSYRGESDRFASGATPEREVLEDLVEACARDVAAKIAPHRVPFQTGLARGSLSKGASKVWSGNRLAKNGDWITAAQHWRQALEQNPENHAAAYNLGLACEAQDDFAGANRMYALAASLKDKELYNDAVARVTRNSRQYEVAQAQIARHRHVPPPLPAYQLASRRGTVGSRATSLTAEAGGRPSWTVPDGHAAPVGPTRPPVPAHLMRRLPPE
jgi:tetratricopeptide (TPR) repeat protein